MGVSFPIVSLKGQILRQEICLLARTKWLTDPPYQLAR